MSGNDDASSEVEVANTRRSHNLSDQRSDPAEAFAALSDPLRVNILRELSAHRRETDNAVVGFADLRRRVGVRDSGRFRYHLNELRDYFLKKTENGYRLTHAGVQVVAAILAGTYTHKLSLGPVDLDSDCPFCGEPAVATYENGVCLVACPNDHPLFQWSVPPNVAANATLPSIVDLAELLGFQAIEQALAGVCPQCYDPIEAEVVVDRPPQPVFRAACDTCGAQLAGPVAFPLLVDPGIAAFCRRHGLTLRDDHVWEFPFVSDDSIITVANEDPLRLEFTIALDDETLLATIDECGHVVAVDPPNGK